MSLGPRPDQGDFASTFPGRFASAMDRAQGVMAGLQAGLGREGVTEDALSRLHEIYRLRIELELETAGVLWRTAEVVCALTDALTAIADRDTGPGGGGRALLEAEGRRRRAGISPTGPLGGRPEMAVVEPPRSSAWEVPVPPAHPGPYAAPAAYPRAA